MQTIKQQRDSQRDIWNKKMLLLKPFIPEELRTNRPAGKSRNTVYLYLNGHCADPVVAERMFEDLVRMAGIGKKDLEKILAGEEV